MKIQIWQTHHETNEPLYLLEEGENYDSLSRDLRLLNKCGINCDLFDAETGRYLSYAVESMDELPLAYRKNN